jgi:hypothetical protein
VFYNNEKSRNNRPAEEVWLQDQTDKAGIARQPYRTAEVGQKNI